MAAADERSYEFRLAAHWRAGARRGLQLRGDRLVVPVGLALRRVPGSGPEDAGALPAVGGGGLTWLRPRSRELVRRLPGERAVSVAGILAGRGTPRRLVVGPSVVWVLAGDRLDRYGAATLQPLTPFRPDSGRRLSDAAGDGADGVWVTEVDRAGRWWLRHLDCWGRTCRGTVPLDGPGGAELSVAAGADGARVVVVDPAAATELLVLDPATGAVARIALDAVHGRGTTLLAAGPADRVHLLTVLEEHGGDGAAAVLQSVDAVSGDVEDHQVLPVPWTLGRPTSLAGSAPDLLLSGTRGLADIVPADAPAGTRRATLITPGLVSPVGPRAGWNRAEVDVALPAGTTLELTWAATDDPRLADEVARVLAGPTTPGVVDQLEELLPWQQGVVYRGTGGGGERLVALLDRVEETTLWLRIELRTAPGAPAPELAGLRVSYPDTSYLDHLPAIYRENPRSAADLRQLLAPYEVLLDGLDETLDSLPSRIDPATAEDGWTDYLLGWLGFPPLGELPAHVRRQLLRRATEILDLRGTRDGLEHLLDLVTEGRATVTDAADEPAGWFLGTGGTPSAGAEPARLGADTVALGRLPRPARAGAMVLGDARLGRTCADPQMMLARRASTVTITLDADDDQRRVLGPVLPRLLDTFVPAHCRVRVRWTGAGPTRSRRLDVDLRLAPGPSAATTPGTPPDSLLHGDTHWRLGATTHLGRWPLPATAGRPLVLGHRARLDTGPRLQ